MHERKQIKMNAIMLTITIPKVIDYSGGMKVPDMMPAGYNASYVN